jgi:asparagine synthase (glutamine-hydrolysing)
MCGISGIINHSNRPVSENEIGEMNQLIYHRGPDGDGFYYGDNFAFGHRRLAILDLSEDGRQPMNYKDDYVITFNGEIYNYIEIREVLIQQGYSFHSKSDTEVILAAYDFWGDECVHQFNGMWSFALYDKKKNRLFCSRDRFGVKPFYYTITAHQFIFGSEIKQLLRFLPKISCNKKVLLDYLIVGIEEYNNETFFEGIVKLEQGSNLVYDLSNHQFEIKKYYQLILDPALKNLNEDEAVKKYHEQLTQAVKLRMRSDVEVGTCLSGGLDSSSITAISSNLMRQTDGKPIKAIHAKAEEKNIDESDFAVEVVAFCGANMEIVTPSFEDFYRVLDTVIYSQEEPFGSPSVVMQYFVLEKAREQNCIVMLDGQGGDESLLGYEKYYPAFLLEKKGFKKVSEFLNSSKNSKLSKMDLLKYYVYFTNYSIRLRRLKKRHNYIKPSVLLPFQSAILKELSKKYLTIDALQKLELSKTQLPHLLRYEDKNSMLHSVETRLPFVDYRCVEMALSMPNGFKIKNGWTKYLLRKGMEGKLPDTIIWRKNKLGFNAPENTWLGNIQDEMIEAIKHSKLLNDIIEFDKMDFKKLDIRTKWRLFNIAKWEQLYTVQS